jgi:hypothetical protein
MLGSVQRLQGLGSENREGGYLHIASQDVTSPSTIHTLHHFYKTPTKTSTLNYRAKLNQPQGPNNALMALPPSIILKKSFRSFTLLDMRGFASHRSVFDTSNAAFCYPSRWRCRC